MPNGAKKNNFTVHIHNKAHKNLLKIPLSWQKRIVEAMDVLVFDPYVGEKLWGKLEGKYKMRIWPYRIVYAVYPKEKIVYVVEIQHRQSVYN